MQPEYFSGIKKYLPSKKFAITIGVLVGGLVLVLLLSSIFGTKSIFDRKKNQSYINPEGTVGDIISRDSNGNEIPDWEESLWGLDPNGDGIENKKIIDAKKLAQQIPVENKEEQNISDTEAFSQDLLSTIIALNQAGVLNEGAINDLAESIGTSVDAKHANVRTYTMSDLKISNSNDAKQTYYRDLKKVIDGYAKIDLGSELSIIATGLGVGGPGELKKLEPFATAYSNLSKQILSLTTPSEIAPSALRLINSSAIMGATLPQIEEFYHDVLAGMVGIDDFTKAKNDSDEASAEISKYFGN